MLYMQALYAGCIHIPGVQFLEKVREYCILKAAYTSSLRPHTLVASGRIH